MASQSASPVFPQNNDSEIARDALVRLREFYNRHSDDEGPIDLAVEGGEHVTVPKGAVEMMMRVLAKMAAGEGVTIVPSHAELTTQQAANMLNVSRPHLIKLLQQGKIDFKMVGTHRRVRADSLRKYLRADDSKRRDAADELTALSQEMGLL
ncbi:excisionase family DNA-binding protein [Saxibacter everestensis]|uniref:Excisionase family DNA-binding protein n=1 Tax=Saxibacter everestensis TaxID=2909229 RepID=A0ABY8QTP2_9MICO|nr:excisionase family DNA-binding protein [Brevibacteriaceae bacterium ZFBP1038]